MESQIRFRMEEELKEKLKEIAKEKGTQLSSVLRYAILEFLKRENKDAKTN